MGLVGRPSIDRICAPAYPCRPSFPRGINPKPNKQVAGNETHLPAQQNQTGPHPWFSGTHGYESGPPDFETTPGERPGPARALSSALSRPRLRATSHRKQPVLKTNGHNASVEAIGYWMPLRSVGFSKSRNVVETNSLPCCIEAMVALAPGSGSPLPKNTAGWRAGAIGSSE